MSKDKKEGSSLNTDGLSSSFAELMKEIFKDEPDYLSASDIDNALGVSFDPTEPIFIGEYYCETSKNRIALPIKNLTVWAIVETFEDSTCSGEGKTRILLSNDISKIQRDSIKIIESGECDIDNLGRWTLPDQVIKLLDSEQLVLEGLFTLAELMTCEDFEISQAEMLERLKRTDGKL